MSGKAGDQRIGINKGVENGMPWSGEVGVPALSALVDKYNC